MALAMVISVVFGTLVVAGSGPSSLNPGYADPNKVESDGMATTVGDEAAAEAATFQAAVGGFPQVETSDVTPTPVPTATPIPPTPTPESVGYRFVPQNDLSRGKDDQQTSPTIAELGLEPASSSDHESTPSETLPTPTHPAGAPLVLSDPPEQRVALFTPGPYPEEWTAPPRETGIFASNTRIIIMVVLLMLVVVAAVGVVKTW
jgi:hypothetical protein